MTGGPQPIPTSLKLLTGRKIKNKGEQLQGEPTPQSGTTCPEFLDAAAKTEWRRIYPELEKLGLITRVDRSALAAYCQCWSDWQSALKILREHGKTYPANNGYLTPRPEVAMARDALKMMLDYESSFGMTPASRTRIRVPNKDSKKTGLKDFIAKNG